MSYTHSQHVVHCDLKLENILWEESSGRVLLVDFGCAAVDPEINEQTRVCGTPWYMAPEQFHPERSFDLYKAEIWSLGVVVFVLLTGLFPFRATTNEELKTKILKMDYTFPASMQINSNLRRFIKSCLQPADRRASMEDLEGLSEVNCYSAGVQ